MSSQDPSSVFFQARKNSFTDSLIQNCAEQFGLIRLALETLAFLAIVVVIELLLIPVLPANPTIRTVIRIGDIVLIGAALKPLFNLLFCYLMMAFSFADLLLSAFADTPGQQVSQALPEMTLPQEDGSVFEESSHVERQQRRE